MPASYGVFTLPDTDTDTNKKWVKLKYAELFTLADTNTDTDTDTDVNGLQTHFVGVGVVVWQCEHTIRYIVYRFNDYDSPAAINREIHIRNHYQCITEDTSHIISCKQS